MYLWAVYLSSVPEGYILVNAIHSRLLGITLGQDVYVSTSHNIRTVESLFIEADGADDQVILVSKFIYIISSRPDKINKLENGTVYAQC